MLLVKVCLLLAAFVPLLSAVAAKAGAKGFTNKEPRPWLASLGGWRARAHAAQANAFEALPFFYGAVLLALWSGAQAATLAGLMVAWLILRVLYLLAYIADKDRIRSLIWFLSLVVTIRILFLGA
ncbi:MAPEG family protein [Alcaligenes endophyticus]|uniref:MAPEG family protein n=1 Tax=Alcaligenes endophyticus TaxID=1929088 RepID=A0ABT8ELG9_9BURK|nr:MAPEG family protein [Alcaligenes endophyticus]MCX5590507.1 MAPEG family protein [Alcaligenes endophyticus]MDN4122130.1 MAPEG family protein [Alcaligenes endophyticus]